MAGQDSDEHFKSTERTPLLPSSALHPAPQARRISAAGTFHTPLEDEASNSLLAPKRKRFWPKFIFLILLLALFAAALVAIFLAPAAAETYAKSAVTLNISSVAIESFTEDGLQARVRGQIKVDASRVENKFVRTLGRYGTAVMKKVSTSDGKLSVFLPEYNNALLGNATIPPMVIDIRDGHTTDLNFTSTVQPDSLESAKKLMNDYLAGDLKSVKVVGIARVDMKTGIVPLGHQLVSETLRIKNLPSLPNPKVTHLDFSEVDHTVEVNASVIVPNNYSIQLTLPPLSFFVSLPACDGSLIKIASASTPTFSVKPKTDIHIDVTGLINALPDNLTQVCPESKRSPMDGFLESYLQGNSSTVYVSGRGKDSKAPKWLVDFLKSVTIPLPFPGHTFNDTVESLGLSHVSFKLPPPSAEPGSPEASPKLSAVVEALVILPPEINFSIDVTNARADADLSYHGDKFGELRIQDWMPASSYLVEENGKMKLKVRAEVVQQPLKVTDFEVFQKVVQRLAWGGGRGLILGVDGTADVAMNTTLGELKIRGVPAKGDVTIKGLPSIGDLLPRATSMNVLSTTRSSMTLSIGLSVTNPTEYSAQIPYLSVLITKDGYIIGNASISSAHITPGDNAVTLITTYDPVGGKEAVDKGLELLSDYVSGKPNTTLTIKPHERSIPSLPELSKALSGLELTLPIPRLMRPSPSPSPSPPDDGDGSDDDDDGYQEFLEKATMHIFSSTVTFLLHNPFPHTPIYIYTINGTAEYNGTELGTVYYDVPWEITPWKDAGGGEEDGGSLSPKLPVVWHLGSAAYAAMVDALGGSLKIDAKAKGVVGVGEWRGLVGFEKRGVKACVRL